MRVDVFRWLDDYVLSYFDYVVDSVKGVEGNKNFHTVSIVLAVIAIIYFMYQTFFVEKHHRTKLHIAAAKDDVLVMKRLLTEGLSISKKDDLGMTPLHVACEAKAGHAVVLLVQQAGEQKADYINTQDKDGQTAMHMAALKGSLPIVRYLVTQGGDKSILTKTETPVVMYASASGNLELLEYLVSIGCDLQAKDNCGVTLVHLATVSGSKNILKYLYEKNVPMDTKDNNGHSAEELARRVEKTEMADFLADLIKQEPAKDEPAAVETVPVAQPADDNKSEISSAALEKKSNGKGRNRKQK